MASTKFAKNLLIQCSTFARSFVFPEHDDGEDEELAPGQGLAHADPLAHAERHKVLLLHRVRLRRGGRGRDGTGSRDAFAKKILARA